MLHEDTSSGYPKCVTAETILQRIQILPDVLVNQIAAGEVIERPASVVKELLENSIDAGATEVRIEIEAGGTGLIRVRDNGQGIHPDDLGLALRSHATSKISRMADLYRISSLGFRGEALSSIASVSHLQLISRMRGAVQAWCIRKSPDSPEYEITPASHPTGTTVEVQSLFHTTPARRKFLRTEHTEFLHVLDMVRRLALSRFDVTLRLLNNGKQVFYCRADAGDKRFTIQSVMGLDFNRMAKTLDCTAGGLRLWGWLGAAEQARSQTDRQYFYFNGRMIRDKHVSHAIRMAYAETLPMGRHPVYVLHLEADPASADINVHPAKFEIRFQHARDVHDFIYMSLKQTLDRDNGVPLIPHAESVSAGVRQPADAGHLKPAADQIREWSGDYRQAEWKDRADTQLQTVTGLGQPVTLMHGRYLISRRDDDFLLIDLIHAHHRIVRQKLQAVTVDSPARQRPLLLPISLRVTAAEAELIEKYGDDIRRYGLSAERNSPETIVIRSIPAVVPDVELQPLLQDLLQVMQQAQGGALDGDRIIQAFENNLGAGNATDMAVIKMQQLHHALAASGIDTRQRDCPGIWVTLNEDTLDLLFKSK